MRFSADEIENRPCFRLVKELRYDEVVEFILGNIRKVNLASLFYVTFNLFLLSWLLVYSYHFFFSGHLQGHLQGHLRWYNVVWYAGLGLVVMPVVLVPLHEMIHGLVYYLEGARNIRFGADLGQFVFYVTAHRCVMGWKGFLPVALSPFTLISILLLIPVLFTSHPLAWSAFLSLFAHSTMCIGDFAMISFFLSHNRKNLYTFDDTEARVAYFYEKTDKQMMNGC